MFTLLETATHSALTPVWFVLVAVLWVGFFFLEGFDFGVAMLLPILGRTDKRKRVMVNTIGPTWDGNEVWLLTAGGATFAAFPGWYATLFSGIYLPLLLVLVGLILRGVAFEYRSKRPEMSHRNLMDWMATIGSFLPSLVLGVGFANFVKGLEVGGNPPLVTTGFWQLFTPFSLLGGVLFVVLFCAHGAVFVALKTKGEVHDDARKLAIGLAFAAAGLSMVWAVWMNVVHAPTHPAAHAITWVLGLVAALAVAGAALLTARGRDGSAFIATSIGVVGLIVPMFLKMYGNLGFISSGDPGLDMWSASSSPYTLKIMTIAAAIFVPIVLAYQAWSYWVFRKRISVQNLPVEAAEPVPAATGA
ncbi:cytochrome d ubiquinol oxidase subunit II [Aestuariimicrobium sp. T2.26MG-19.2B]|uniref:cytochrome d ubiquinol oxidase subunit II n=1 Tax=Aestuariimicrobium sp. T2.26MG-19.2B TaxID=3040679 RepID=UPI0024776729|nr:cytochrome d ubiquinol oxidase subunit II [Aestuariimicrobium sp. T2.26MG-19.2B]CAI9404550.1 Cytochrome bd-I ubiquinol oxidase subunit 2 [Aestuariimicrobium sp. T2.26MG-19.2B]